MEKSDIKVLSIGSDRNLFVEGSGVSERIKEYGSMVKELHIVVMSTGAHGLKEKKLGENVWLYPTNSLTRWLYPFSAARIGKRLIYERKFVRGRSVITAQDPFECGLAGLMVKKKWRIPLEIQLHTNPFSPYFAGFLNNVRKNMAEKVLRAADSIRVVSQELKQKLTAESLGLKAGISVLPIFVDVERIEEGHISFDVHARFGWHFVMLCASRLASEKNLSLAIETLARVRASFPDAGLVIVGSGPEESRLKSLARKLGVDRNVAFEGWQENLSSYYKTASVFLQTSFFEGYGLALVEAGLSGLPVISTPVGIAAELDAGKDLYICPQGDAGCFSAAVMDLLEHNHKRENLRLNMKRSLGQKLLSKSDYMAQIKANWESTASKVKA